MRRASSWTLILTFACGALHAASPETLNNDDSCDISVAPAATLLLPYFEVTLDNPAEETTLFTVTNVGPLPQIARVTLWTDLAYPVLTFNIFLTGYDVQSINLYDVLARGRIAEPGTSSNSEVGLRSADNNMNPLHGTTHCADLPDSLPPQTLADVRSALTAGRTTGCGKARIGSQHARAIGYATIDVVQNCSSTMPVDAGYFTTQIMYDNVLIGDYQQVDRANNFARGNTLVHIRAIPEGGLTDSARTKFRRTFYSRLQNGGTVDRRQPLPSTFAARWINGGVGALDTSVKVWREARTSAAAGCAVSSITTPYPDIVRFDEEENPTGFQFDCPFTCPAPVLDLPVVARLNIDNSGEYLPPNPDSALAGWMYFNLNTDSLYGQPPNENATQSWVVVSMGAEGRFSVDFDAAYLGNGCSPRTPYTDEDGDAPAIGPAANVNPESSPNP